MAFPSFEGLAHDIGSITTTPSMRLQSPAAFEQQAVDGSSLRLKSTNHSTKPPPIQKRGLKSKHQSCEPCRRKKTKCDRKEFCSSCKIRGEACFWEGAVPIAPMTAKLYPQASIAAQREITRLRNLVHHLASRLGVDPAMDLPQPEAFGTYYNQPQAYSPPVSECSFATSPPIYDSLIVDSYRTENVLYATNTAATAHAEPIDTKPIIPTYQLQYHAGDSRAW